MGPPGSAKAVLGFEDHKASSRALLQELIGAADPGYTSADDQHIEVLNGGGRHLDAYLLGVEVSRRLDVNGSGL